MPASQLAFSFAEPRLPWLPAPEPVRAPETARVPTDLDVEDWLSTHGLRKVTPTRKGWLAAVEIVSVSYDRTSDRPLMRTVDGVTLGRVLQVEDEGHARSVMLSGGTEPVKPHRNFHRVLVIRAEWQPHAEYVLAASGPGHVWPDEAALIAAIEDARTRGCRAARPKPVPPPAPVVPPVPSLPATPPSPEAFGLAAFGRLVAPEDCLALMHRRVTSAAWVKEPHEVGDGYAAEVTLDLEMWDGLAATAVLAVTVPWRPADGDLVRGTDWRYAAVKGRWARLEGGPCAAQGVSGTPAWVWRRVQADAA